MTKQHETIVERLAGDNDFLVLCFLINRFAYFLVLRNEYKFTTSDITYHLSYYFHNNNMVTTLLLLEMSKEGVETMVGFNILFSF